MAKPQSVLLLAAAAAFALSGCASAQMRSLSPPAPAHSGSAPTLVHKKASTPPQVLRLGRCKLRFTGVGEGIGTGTEGTVSYFLELGFTNDGHACSVGPRSHLAMTARTDTHGLVRAKFSGDRLSIRHREHVTMVVGIWWRQHRCTPGGLTSVVFHNRRGSQTVSFPRHPYVVCTPAGTSFYLQRFPA